MLTSNTSHTDLHYKLGEILNNGLLHMVEKPTRENNTLNLIITNNLTLPWLSPLSHRLITATT